MHESFARTRGGLFPFTGDWQTCAMKTILPRPARSQRQGPIPPIFFAREHSGGVPSGVHMNSFHNTAALLDEELV